MSESTIPASQRANSAINAAIALLRSDDNLQALFVLEHAFHLEQPPVREFNHLRGVCLSRLARFDDAAEALVAELTGYPDNTPARELLTLIENQYLRGKTNSPLQGAVQRLTTNSAATAAADPSSMATEALEKLAHGDGAGALLIADAIVETAPRCGGVNFLRMLCLQALSRLEEAFLAAQQELLVNPTHAAARVSFEQLATVLGRKAAPGLNPEQRTWESATDRNIQGSIHDATQKYTYRGVSMPRSPFDLAIYPLLLWDAKPRTIIEVGARRGTSSVWFADALSSLGIDGHVYSINSLTVTNIAHPRVTFLQGDTLNIAATLSSDWLASLPRPLLFICNAELPVGLTRTVLAFCNKHLLGDEYLVLHDETRAIDSSSQAAGLRSNTREALEELIANNPGVYEVAAKYVDWFGCNSTSCANGILKKRRHAPNVRVSRAAIVSFLSDDPVPRGLESQMSPNERFQLYTAVRKLLPRTERVLRYIEIGSHAGASLMLEHIAARYDGRALHPIAIEPIVTSSFLDVVRKINATHIKAFSHDALIQVRDIIADGVRPEFIVIDGNHTYEGVKQDILDYYDVLAPGGIMIFHDFLPELTSHNQDTIFFHHGGKEPGIRQACLEVMQKHFGAVAVELPLLYPTDATQTQPHLPIIPDVYSTLKVYRKPK